MFNARLLAVRSTSEPRSERNELLRRSARSHVALLIFVSFLFFSFFSYPASSPSPLVRRQSSLQAHDTRLPTRPNRSPFSPHRPFPFIFPFFCSSRLTLSNNITDTKATTTRQSYTHFFISLLVFPLCTYIYYSSPITSTPEVAATIQNLD